MLLPETKAAFLQACICGDSCICARRECFSSLPVPPSKALCSSASLLQKRRGGRWQVASRAPHAASRGCRDAPATPEEQEGGWEPNQSLLVVPDICQSKSLCKFGAVWFPWLSKHCCSSRLRKMHIMRKTRGEKITTMLPCMMVHQSCSC